MKNPLVWCILTCKVYLSRITNSSAKFIEGRANKCALSVLMSKTYSRALLRGYCDVSQVMVYMTRDMFKGAYHESREMGHSSGFCVLLTHPFRPRQCA